MGERKEAKALLKRGGGGGGMEAIVSGAGAGGAEIIWNLETEPEPKCYF